MISHAGSNNALMHDNGSCSDILGNNVAVCNMLLTKKALDRPNQFDRRCSRQRHFVFYLSFEFRD